MRTIILATLAALVALATPATAAPTKPGCNLAIDKLRPECQTQQAASAANDVVAVLAKPLQDLSNFISGDLDAALALSTVIPDLQDGNGQQCWIAAKSFTEVVQQHPIPLTFHALTDLQAARLLTAAARRVCADPHCSQVFADLANGVQVAAPVNLSVPVPSLNSICAKIPQIELTAPVALPPAKPAPTPPATPSAQ